MRFLRLLFFLLLLWGMAACVQQVDPSVDIPAMSYQSDIAPIINGNCAIPGCHATGDEEFPLETYDDVIHYCDVQAGKPHSSRLYKVIRKYIGGSAMPPKPNAPLTDEQIAMIYVWILQGAKDN